MTEKITVQNTINGEVSVEDASFLDNPHFKQAYVEVPAGTKPYHPDFYKPKTAEEFKAAKPGRTVVKPGDEVVGEASAEQAVVDSKPLAKTEKDAK